MNGCLGCRWDSASTARGPKKPFRVVKNVYLDCVGSYMWLCDYTAAQNHEIVHSTWVDFMCFFLDIVKTIDLKGM